MSETYDITHGNESVGTAKMEKQGLYYCFSCRCRLPEEGLYRIHVICGKNREDLGICIPLDGAFGMDKRIPAKRVGEGVPAFELVPKDRKPQEEVVKESPETTAEEDIPTSEAVEEMPAPESVEDNFIPVSEEEPFEHLDQLEDAVLTEQDGQLGIALRETTD